MIIYTNKINDFNKDVDQGVIVDKLSEKLSSRGIFNSDSEARSWSNSLMFMKNVLYSPQINQELHIAIEYNIPNTSKRVDFMISGLDEEGNEKVLVIELKQWEKVERTSRNDLVTTYIGKAVRAVPHPSYQAYSYAKTIENFNSTIYEKNVELIPSAFLHNYKEEYRSELEHPIYSNILKKAPIFLQRDAEKLRNFIVKHVKKSDHGKLLYEIDHGKIKPSKALQDAIHSMLKGNEEFVMIDEQKVIFSTVKKVVENALLDGKKYTIIVEGGPGTGKSVLAINLLAEFTKKEKLVNYVTKNAAPRKVYFSLLRRQNYKLNYIRNLFKSSSSYGEATKNQIDLLLVDEAHRLIEKGRYDGAHRENQIAEIIKAAKVSVFFIDEDQIVTTSDFGSVDEIVKQAKRHKSTILRGEEYNLVSQFRCNGSDGYLAFLDDLLQIRQTANFDGFDGDYDIRIFDSPSEMREELRKLNKINNKSRMVAGYTYNWDSKKNPNSDVYDIVLKDDFKAKWNFNNTDTWAIDDKTFDQVGCIHTSQGLEFDYVGVIIGKDLVYRDNKVITDYTKRAKTDQSLRGIVKYVNGLKKRKIEPNVETDDGLLKLSDRIIRNTYKTLLTRGQKGCFIYCEDEKLAKYIKERLELVYENR